MKPETEILSQAEQRNVPEGKQNILKQRKIYLEAKMKMEYWY